VSRWEREDVLDAMGERLDLRPEMMRLRRDTVAHPFGTLKRWMGAEHFLTRGLHNVGTQMSLRVLSYNLKRVINIMGVEALVRALYVLFIALCLRLPYSSASYARAKAY
jgi:transposase